MSVTRPERIGVFGGSAGGYLSAFVATTSGGTEFDVGENPDRSSSVKCAVDVFGLSDLTLSGKSIAQISR